MSKQSKESTNEPIPSRPGSSADDAMSPENSGDFGIPERDVIERTYTSRNTKRADPNVLPPRSAAGGQRVSGAGGNDSGPGSSSGGDLDPAVIGFGQGGIAASGKIHEAPGPDDAQSTSHYIPPGQESHVNPPSPDHGGRISGSTVQAPDERTIGPQGADGISRVDSDDDSFVGEISSSEASGRDDAGV